MSDKIVGSNGNGGLFRALSKKIAQPAPAEQAAAAEVRKGDRVDIKSGVDRLKALGELAAGKSDLVPASAFKSLNALKAFHNLDIARTTVLAQTGFDINTLPLGARTKLAELLGNDPVVRHLRGEE